MSMYENLSPIARSSPLRILLLEDSELDAELVCEHVKDAGLDHAIDRVVARQDFLHAISRGQYDLILADYVLPSFDGLAALALARQHCPDIPFVFVSGTLGEDVVVEAMKDGATDYVTKQKLDRLPRTVLRALKEAQIRRQRTEAELALQELNETLERRVEERTRELAEANRQLKEQIAERERVEAVLRQTQRLEAVGQLTSGVAHDFNNLLTVILGNISMLERNTADAGLLRRLSLMRVAAERGAGLTKQLLAFSRRQQLDPKPLDLNVTVRSLRDLLQSSMGGAIEIDAQLAPDLWPTFIDPTQLELALLNLAINARDAMPEGGFLSIRTENVTLGAPVNTEAPPAGQYVMIAVTDSGCGIPRHVLEHVFEPFFTTKEVGKGSGLGLAQVHGFAHQSGGSVLIESEAGRGTCVRLYFPRAAVAQDSTWNSIEAPEMRSPDRGGTILVVDDDAAVREVTTSLLRDGGYDVVEAANGRRALETLAAGRSVDLLLVDFAMPGMTGAELVTEIRRNAPDLPVLFLTGHADHAAIAALGLSSTVVQKPYDSTQLAQRVAQALRDRFST